MICSVSPEQREWKPPEVDLDVLRARWALAQRHPLYFLRWFAWTCDQHDKENPIKQFPWQLPYLQVMTGLWLDNPRLSVLKTRQMRMTWLFVALACWDAGVAQGRRGRLIMLQSKREEDAVGDETAGDGLLGRGKFIFNHMPGRPLLLPDYTPMGTKILFPSRASTLWAIPQGASIIRQRTASGILSDEAAHQIEAGNAYTAARPCIRGGGWYVNLTTPSLADGGHTRRLHEDRLGDDR